jgi:hypothetical protein
MRVSDKHLLSAREQGFTVVEGFLEQDLLEEAQNALWSIFPKPEDYFADPSAYEKIGRSQFAGLRLFPYNNWALDRLAVHPDLVDAAKRFCGTSDLDLYKIELWAKYAGATNYDQAHHRDYSNHTIVVPERKSEFVQMTTFILLSDVTEVDGPTKILPLSKTSDVPLIPDHLPMGAKSEHEISAIGKAGSLLIYNTDVLHRGSNFTAANRSRFAMLVDFQPRGRPWTGKIAWPTRAVYPGWSKAMANMTPEHRCLFGFPAPGDDYWDDQTLRDVGMRYPDMDMSPYIEAQAA